MMRDFRPFVPNSGRSEQRQIVYRFECARIPQCLSPIEPHGAKRVRGSKPFDNAWRKLRTLPQFDNTIVRTSCIACRNQPRGRYLRQSIDLAKPQPHGWLRFTFPLLERVVPVAFIDIDRMYFHAMLLRIAYDLRGGIKTHRL